MKLELKHLAGYLPYGLKGIMYYGGCVCENVELGLMDIPVWLNGSYPIKPILHPLSELTKEIDIHGEKFVPVVEIMKIKDNGDWLGVQHKKIDEMPFYVIQKLLEWHFDIYGLIENGLAIDINTLNK